MTEILILGYGCKGNCEKILLITTPLPMGIRDHTIYRSRMERAHLPAGMTAPSMTAAGPAAAVEKPVPRYPHAEDYPHSTTRTEDLAPSVYQDLSSSSWPRARRARPRARRWSWPGQTPPELASLPVMAVPAVCAASKAAVLAASEHSAGGHRGSERTESPVTEALRGATGPAFVTTATSPFAIMDVNDEWLATCGFSIALSDTCIEVMGTAGGIRQGPHTELATLTNMMKGIGLGQRVEATLTNFSRCDIRLRGLL